MVAGNWHSLGIDSCDIDGHALGSSLAIMELSALESINNWTSLLPILPGFSIGGAVKEPNKQGMLTKLILIQASAS